MDEPVPTHDPLEDLQFTFKSDEAFVEPSPSPTETEAGEPDPGTHARLPFGETPMTDLRSLGSSVVLHTLLLALASLAVLNVATSKQTPGPAGLVGELEPVDDRAEKNRTAASGHGGRRIAPGEIGGLGNIPFEAAPAEDAAHHRSSATRLPMRLFSEILPSTTSKPDERLEHTCPVRKPPEWGLCPGRAEGAEAVREAVSGGGMGRGIGPGTEFLERHEHGHSFAYVIDCSGSMATRNSLEVADANCCPA